MKHYSFIVILFSLATISNGYICDRTPKKAEKPKPNTDKYVIEIVGNPPTYSSGQTYTVVLKSNPQNPITNYFTEFMMVVEPDGPVEALQNVLTGDLKPADHSLARFTPKCPSAITHTNNLAKSSVEIFWTAPPSGNGCVFIRATVYESSDSWYSDDGGLTKKICEEEENKDVQPPFLEQCCACNEAKYEVAFQGMWTRNTHPKDYPPNMWTTKLGEVIGASHKFSKAFWNYSSTASEGLKLLAEDGDTSVLENELKELVKSDDIRTIIKARELSYPNITGTSYTVFRVDQEHHLISLVSKITPSPDWIVGVANLELCTPNCEWIQSRTLNLYPWDVGTDDGTSYNSLDAPSATSEVVKQITSDLEGYPFYSESGEPIKPLAQLRVTRQKQYEKVCDESEGLKEDACSLSEWSSWSTCSTTCGSEIMTRERTLLNPENKAECMKNGRLELQENRRCETDVECEPTECTNATWTEWTTCSVTCGAGVKTRQGKIFFQETSDEYKENEETCEETVTCIMPECDQDSTTAESYHSISGESQVTVLTEAPDGPVIDCEVSQWSDWGPCSVTEPCSRGFQYKERHIITHPHNGGKACPKRLRREKRCRIPCKGESEERTAGEVDCKMSPWSDWTPCSSNCGSSAVQIRTRTIEVQPTKNGKKCGPRLEERKCSLPYSCNDREWLFLNKY